MRLIAVLLLGVARAKERRDVERDDKSGRGTGKRSRSTGGSDAVITVPADMASELRNGLHSVLGEGAEGISATTELSGRERHPEWYSEHRERCERTSAVLDLIGWGEPKQPAAITIDLRQHHRTVRFSSSRVMRRWDARWSSNSSQTVTWRSSR